MTVNVPVWACWLLFSCSPLARCLESNKKSTKQWDTTKANSLKQTSCWNKSRAKQQEAAKLPYNTRTWSQLTAFSTKSRARNRQQLGLTRRAATGSEQRRKTVSYGLVLCLCTLTHKPRNTRLVRLLIKQIFHTYPSPYGVPVWPDHLTTVPGLCSPDPHECVHMAVLAPPGSDDAGAAVGCQVAPTHRHAFAELRGSMETLFSSSFGSRRFCHVFVYWPQASTLRHVVQLVWNTRR